MVKYLCPKCKTKFSSKYLAQDCCKGYNSSYYTPSEPITVDDGLSVYSAMSSIIDSSSPCSSSDSYSGGGGSFDGGGCSSDY